jgi:hypothetical protein
VYPSVLTPLQLIAGDSLLQNSGMAVNSVFSGAVVDYENLPLIAPFLDAMITGNTSGGNANTKILSNSTMLSLETLASATCPALADSVPTTYSSIGVSINGFTGIITAQANQDLGNGDLSKFAQALSSAEGYCSITNQFINSAVNGNTYLANTFTSMNNMITGDVTQVNLATAAFSQDLANVGTAIDLGNLNDLGSPFLLLQQINRAAGGIPTNIVLALSDAGVTIDVILNLSNPTLSVTDSIQKFMYTAMTQITGSDLAQVLQILKVQTPGINTMADLLNPVKLFPSSFQSLTVSTTNGLQPIYIDNTGAVNTNLVDQLPPYVVSSLI